LRLIQGNGLGPITDSTYICVTNVTNIPQALSVSSFQTGVLGGVDLRIAMTDLTILRNRSGIGYKGKKYILKGN